MGRVGTGAIRAGSGRSRAVVTQRAAEGRHDMRRGISPVWAIAVAITITFPVTVAVAIPRPPVVAVPISVLVRSVVAIGVITSLIALAFAFLSVSARHTITGVVPPSVDTIILSTPVIVPTTRRALASSSRRVHNCADTLASRRVVLWRLWASGQRRRRRGKARRWCRSSISHFVPLPRMRLVHCVPVRLEAE